MINFKKKTPPNSYLSKKCTLFHPRGASELPILVQRSECTKMVHSNERVAMEQSEIHLRSRMLPDLARSPDLGRPDLARSGKFFFFFEKKFFPRRPRSGQIWPDLATSGRSGTSGKFFFSRYPQ